MQNLRTYTVLNKATYIYSLSFIVFEAVWSAADVKLKPSFILLRSIARIPKDCHYWAITEWKSLVDMGVA